MSLAEFFVRPSRVLPELHYSDNRHSCYRKQTLASNKQSSMQGVIISMRMLNDYLLGITLCFI